MRAAAAHACAPRPRPHHLPTLPPGENPWWQVELDSVTVRELRLHNTNVKPELLNPARVQLHDARGAVVWEATIATTENVYHIKVDPPQHRVIAAKVQLARPACLHFSELAVCGSR